MSRMVFVITPQVRAWIDKGIEELEAYANGD